MPLQKIEIDLKKMATDFSSEVIYYLHTKTGFIILNDLMGHVLSFEFLRTKCQSCQQPLPLFRQGYCKRCFFESPETADWIMKPELSQAHLGIPHRDLAFEKKIQLQPHIVYISDTGQPKVGITRKNQKLHRWIDQGAIQALAIMELPNRYLAGVAEVFLKQHLSDKTSWQKMLSQSNPSVDLLEIYKQIQSLNFPDELKAFQLSQDSVVSIFYPAEQIFQKFKQVKINEEHRAFKAKLSSIKGQYLVFENGEVLNVRTHAGISVMLELS